MSAIARGQGWAVLHDPVLVTAPHINLFDPARWEEQLQGHSGQGRGRVSFVAAGDTQWALRHYRRGGLVGRFIADRYPWCGEARTRSFREWRMLERLHAAALPVPRPVAAGWQRSGPFYTADLATIRISGAVALSARLRAGDAVDWEAIGRTLREFHAAGACHADLNAHNILVDEDGQTWLLDFDRGRFRPPGGWQQDNLSRLERSLRKIAREPGCPAFDDAGWAALREGYRAARQRPRRASGP